MEIDSIIGEDDNVHVYEGNCKLISKEGFKIEVSKKSAVMSTLIEEMLNEDEDEDEDDDIEIPLPNVTKDILERVVAFCNYHVDKPMKEISKPLKSARINDFISEFDAKFINVEQEIVFELILAANYLDIQSLLDLGCAKIASMIKGKTPEQIRTEFNVVGEFTPEEEAAVAKENKWMEQPEN